MQPSLIETTRCLVLDDNEAHFGDQVDNLWSRRNLASAIVRSELLAW